MSRIVIIGTDSFSLVNFRLPFIISLQNHGHEVYAVAAKNDPDMEKVLQNHGIHFYPLNLNRHSTSVLDGFLYFFQLRRILKVIKPDVCLAYTIKPVIFGIIAAKSLGIKRNYALITGLGYAFIATGLRAKLVFSIVYILYKIAFIFCDKVIFQNNDDKKYCCELNLLEAKKAAVINGSGVDLSRFSPVSFPVQLTFLMVARFLPEKGIIEYVKSCEKLKKAHPNVRCFLVGYIDNISGGITENDIQSWQAMGIEYFGKQKDVRVTLSEASVFVLPSYREGTSRAVLEAMAMGRPIITTDAPGCRETVIDSVNGFLVPIKSSEALYEAMLRFVHNRSLISRMGDESLKMVRKKFNVDNINRDMLNIMSLVKI